MRRRGILTIAGSATILAASRVAAQQPAKLFRVGLLSNNSWSDPAALTFWGAFRSELQRLGWTEGRTISFELASSDGDFERLPSVARELIGRGVDLIAVAGGLAAQAVKDATSSIPVMFMSVVDPLAAGLVSSLAHPGGNLTGMANMSVELIGKRLQLVIEVAGNARRLGLLTTGTGAAWADEEASRATSAAGREWRLVPVHREADLVPLLTAQRDLDAWFVADTILTLRRQEVVAAFATLRKPVVYPNSSFVQQGGLLSYGANNLAQARRAGWFTDRILRGTKPAAVPVELPTQFELAVNLKTGRDHGLNIPQAVLSRADEIID